MAARIYFSNIFMLMLKQVAIPFFLLSLSGGLFSAEESLDLKRAIQIAVENNPRIQVLSANKLVAEADIKIAQQIGNPSLIGEVTRSQPNYFAGAGYTFELGGKRDKRTQVARSAAEVAEIEYRLGLFSLRHDVRIAFYTVLQSRGKKEEAAVSRDLARRIADIAQQRFDAGDVARMEVLAAQLELKQRENELRLAETDERSARLAFAALLNQPLTENATLQGQMDTIVQAPALDSLLAEATAHHLELQSMEQQIHGEEANLALAHALRVPDLETEAGTEIHDADFQYGWRVALRFDLPLLNRRAGEILHSDAVLQSLRSQAEATRRKITADISGAYLKYEAALYQAENYRKDILPSSKELETMAQESYQEGRTGIAAVLEAQRSSRQVRAAYYDVLLQYQTALADLELASGVEQP